MDRPAVDVVVPFAGSQEQRRELESRLSGLRRNPGDKLFLVHNAPGPPPPASPGFDGELVHAPDIQTPAHARAEGARRGQAEWIVFFDADLEPAPDLLDRYFDPVPAGDVGLLAGGVRDEASPAGAPAAARWSSLRSNMSQDTSFQHGEWAFAQTANCACRREALDAAGGFREEIRAGEDADLCYRLRRAGWRIDRREEAYGVHRNRATVKALLRQQACHGAGAAWLDREYPGSFPARRRPGLVWWGVRTGARGLARAARSRDRDAATLAVLDPLTTLAFEFGRSLSNERSRSS